MFKPSILGSGGRQRVVAINCDAVDHLAAEAVDPSTMGFIAKVG